MDGVGPRNFCPIKTLGPGVLIVFPTCQRCGSSGPWWWWGYGMGRCMLWTTYTGAFYWWHFECTEIPRPIVVPFIHDHHLMLQHDDTRPHVARICTQFLETENIPVLACPAYSPDMSFIEHVWDGLDWRIQQRVPVPANIQQLRTAIEEEWTNITQATINNLLNSMWRRCVALREANGGHTRYWLVFGPPGPPNTVILHILEWPFIVASLIIAHLCNNHAV